MGVGVWGYEDLLQAALLHPAVLLPRAACWCSGDWRQQAAVAAEQQQEVQQPAAHDERTTYSEFQKHLLHARNFSFLVDLDFVRELEHDFVLTGAV